MIVVLRFGSIALLQLCALVAFRPTLKPRNENRMQATLSLWLANSGLVDKVNWSLMLNDPNVFDCCGLQPWELVTNARRLLISFFSGLTATAQVKPCCIAACDHYNF